MIKYMITIDILVGIKKVMMLFNYLPLKLLS